MKKLIFQDLTSKVGRKWQFAGAVLALGVACLYSAWAARPETPGEHFERFMAAWTKKCATMKLAKGETTCDILKLKPRNYLQTKLVPVAGQPEPVPEEWLATPEGSFAHSIKIPNPVPEDSGYRPGMTPQQYFEHLCKTEAGEFIYNTVDNIEGIFQMRPRQRPTDYELAHLYALEDPYGQTYREHDEPESLYVKPTLYKFFETPFVQRKEPAWKKPYRHPSFFMEPDVESNYVRYLGYDGQNPKTMRKEYDKNFKSRYGYTWRGIRRLHDREFGVAGGELIILDLHSEEVLGVKRGFLRAVPDERRPTGIVWAKVCPLPGGKIKSPHEFIFQVLKPVPAISVPVTGGHHSTK